MASTTDPPAARAPGKHTPPPAASLSAVRTDRWAPPVPLHLARLEGEPAEEHILRGLD